MSRRFSWFTEDETRWHDDQPLPEMEGVAPPGRRWPRLVVVALVLLGFGWVILRQVNQRLAMATTVAATDIRSSYDLLSLAIVQRDAELFNLVIASDASEWKAVQIQLLADGLLFDRYPMGLEAQTVVPQLVSITPAPDMNEAEVTVAGQYSMHGLGPVTLQQTFVFRPGRQRWLLAPPAKGFWGEWQTGYGQLLTIVFRQRDQAIASRLLADLDAQLAVMCGDVTDIECPDDLNLWLRLDSDPASLAALTDGFAGLTGRLIVDLPTPSLVGLPVDEAGYQLLRQSYALPVVRAAIAQLIGWECCERGLFFQALLDFQLAELGLQPWPLTAQEYETMFNNPVVNLRRLGRYWPASPERSPGWRQVYAVVAYVLAKDPSVSAATMQRQLVAADGYWRWMRRYLPDMFALSTQQNWLNHAQSYLGPPDVTLPEQDILLLCDAGVGETSSLYRYQFSAEAWRTEFEDRPVLSIHALSGDAGVLFQERPDETGQTQAVLWREGEERPLFRQSLTFGLFRVESAGEYMFLYGYDFLERFTSIHRLDLTQCEMEGCATTRLAGSPTWSPDRRRTLVAAEDGMLWLGDDRGAVRQPLGTGSAPFWLGNDTYGFARPENGRLQPFTEVVVAEVAALEAQVWLRLEELVTSVSTDIDADELTIDATAVNPANPDLLMVAVSPVNAGERDKSYVFAMDRQTGQISLPITLDFGFGRTSPFGFSPDGRWLTVNSFDRRSVLWQLHLYDVITGRTQTLTSATPFTVPGYDWSSDSQWLLRVQAGYVHLLAPSQGAQQIIDHPFGNCSFSTWTD